MKKISIILLAVLMLFCSTYAKASDTTIADPLYKYAFFTDTLQTGEKKSGIKEREITMEEGEYKKISPVHWILSSHLSYQLSSISVSDPMVVGASFSKESGGNLGISLHALSAGEAVVTATYSTYLSRLGTRYKDKRSVKTFSQRIKVKVEPVGSVNVKLNISGGNYKSVKGVTLRLQTMYDLMSASERAEIRGDIDEAVAEYTSKLNPIDQQIGLIIGKTKSCLKDTAIDYIERTGTAAGYITAKPLATTLRGLDLGYDIIGDIDEVWHHTNRIRKAYLYGKYKTLKIPTYYPNTITLEVTVENNTMHTIQDVSIRAKGDSHLSFYGISGIKGTEKTIISGANIEAGKTKKYSVQIYPAFVYNVLCSDTSSPPEAYTTKVEVACHYSIMETGKTGEETKSITLPVHTAIDLQELQSFKNAIRQEYNAERVDVFTSSILGGAFNGYKKWYGFERFIDVFSFACPVDISIYNTDGQLLAVLSQEETLFTDGILTAQSTENKKYIIVPAYAAHDYTFEAQATDEGTMDVVTYTCNEEKGFAFTAYEAVELRNQDRFMLTIDDEHTPGLVRKGPSDENSLIKPTVNFGQEEILDLMKAEDYSEDEATAFLDLAYRGFIPETITGSGKTGAGVNVWCEILARIAEDYLGIYSENTGSEGVSWKQKATDLGLLPENIISKREEESLTVNEALQSAYDLVQIAGLADAEKIDTEYYRITGDQEENEQGTNPETGNREELTGRNNSQNWIAAMSFGLNGSEPLTNGTALLLADRIVNYLEAAIQGNNLIKETIEAYEGSINWYDDHRESGLYAMDPENEPEQLLSNGGLWYPTYTRYDFVYGDLQDSLVQLLKLNRNKEALKVSLGKREGLRLVSGLSLNGVFVDDDGSIFRWVAFCEINEAGEIQGDAVYLSLAKLTEGGNQDYMNRYGVNQTNEDYCLTYILIADQDTVAAILNRLYDSFPVQEIKATETADNEQNADVLILDWIERHRQSENIRSGMQTIQNRYAKVRTDNLKSIIEGANGFRQPDSGVSEIPDEIAELGCEFPASIAGVSQIFPVDGIREAADELWLDSVALEIASVGEAWRDNWQGKVLDASFMYITNSGERNTIPVEWRKMDGYTSLQAKDSLPYDDISTYYLMLNYEYNGEIYQASGNGKDYYSITTSVRTYNHPDYAAIQYQLSYIRGSYIDPYYIIKLVLEDNEGTESTWSMEYSENGDNKGTIHYSETTK